MFETKRLILRTWLEPDIVELAKINQDVRVMQYMSSLVNEQETRAFVEKVKMHFQAYGFGYYACVLKETNRCIGFVGLMYRDFDAPFTPCFEIAWRLAYDAWGHGYATEAAQAVLKQAFTEFGLSEVVSWTSLTNVRSQKVMQRLEMSDKVASDFYHPALSKEHPLAFHVFYKISKNEFEKIGV